MLDWLAVWGVTSAVGLVFKPILEDLTKDATKDWAKDLMKDSLKNVLRLPSKEPVDIAAGKALKEFLQLVQDELEDADISEAELKQYIKPLKQFINNKSVKEILGSAFKDDCQVLDAATLAKTWNQLNLLSLPDEFDWKQVGKRYVKKVKAIVRESDELRAILDSQKLEGIEQNTRELAGIVPEFDLRRYQEGLKERYSNLNLDSLDTSVYDYREKLKVWQVFIAQNVRECQDFLPQVYEIPKEHQRRMRESNELEVELDLEEWERYKQVYYQQRVRSVLDIVNDAQTYPYIVILGDPGSGKSMLLQYLALNWARTPLNNVISQPIRLLIELRSYSRDRNSGQCKDFLEFCHNGNVICRLNQHQLHEQLKAGKVLVMFDGLDEVFDPAQREEVITDIHRFTNDYPNVRVIVTSRIIGYKPQRLRDAQFRHFMLQDLESDQIQDFIYRWHELTFTDEADKVRKRERLQQAINTSKAIGELAGNPLLLTMMAILNRNQELPRDRPELYNQASRVLLHQWDVEQKLLENPRIDSVAIDYKDKQAMLRQIAYFMQAADKGLAGNLIRGEDLEKILTGYLRSIGVSEARKVARLLIEQLRSRNFILCYLGADSYGFVHRTFLEYFCASEFVERFGKRGLEGGLTIEELKTEVFGKQWWDETWHEVLRLIAGMIEPKFVGEIINYLIELNNEEEAEFEPSDQAEWWWLRISLAAKCLSEVRNRSTLTPIDNRLLNHLKNATNFDPQFDCYIDNDDPALNAYSNVVLQIRTEAISIITTMWRNHPETLPWLKTLAQSGYSGDDGGSVQITAVQELARGWKDDPETLIILKTLAQSIIDDYPFSIYYQGQQYVQATAVQELGRGWKDDPEILVILKALAQSQDEKNNTAKRAAIGELVKGWKNDLDTLSVLKSCTQLDNDGYLKEKVMQELIQYWQASPDIYDFLYECAVDDSFNPVSLAYLLDDTDDTENPPARQVALEAIIEQYSDHPQTLSLLQDRAENDPDEKVRNFAGT